MRQTFRYWLTMWVKPIPVLQALSLDHICERQTDHLPARMSFEIAVVGDIVGIRCFARWDGDDWRSALPRPMPRHHILTNRLLRRFHQGIAGVVWLCVGPIWGLRSVLLPMSLPSSTPIIERTAELAGIVRLLATAATRKRGHRRRDVQLTAFAP